VELLITQTKTGGVSEIHEVAVYFVCILVKCTIEEQAKKLIAGPQNLFEAVCVFRSNQDLDSGAEQVNRSVNRSVNSEAYIDF